MSKKTSHPFQDSSFLEAQKVFIEAWSNMSELMSQDKKASSTTNVNNAWAQAMDFWSRSSNNFMPDEAQHVFSNLIEQAKVYNLLGEQFNSFMNKYNSLDKNSKDWNKQLETYFGEFISGLSGQGNQASNIMQQMLGVWNQLPMDTIQRTMSSASLMPGDFLQGMKNDAFNAATEKYLSVPGIGYSRESQESYLKGIRLAAKYQNALNEFNNANSRVGIEALDRLQKKIFTMAEEGKEINSLREVYDLWVDANEDAYAEFVYSKEYQKLYSELVNRLMEFKQHNQHIIDESLASMNIPTRKGVDTVKKRQQELRRELLATKQTLKEYEKEVSLLKDKVISLEKSSAKKSVSSKKKVSKKAKVKAKSKSTSKVQAKKKSKKKSVNKNITVSKQVSKSKAKTKKKPAKKPVTLIPGMKLIEI